VGEDRADGHGNDQSEHDQQERSGGAPTAVAGEAADEPDDWYGERRPDRVLDEGEGNDRRADVRAELGDARIEETACGGERGEERPEEHDAKQLAGPQPEAVRGIGSRLRFMS